MNFTIILTAPITSGERQVNFMRKKKSATLNDGCNPELVAGARFDGDLEIPSIVKPEKGIIPDNIVPFSERKKCSPLNSTIGFFEMDEKFADVLISPDKYIDEFLSYQAIVSPDCSLYRNMPLSAQITNIYRSRAIGGYYQRKGVHVIPLIRWGSEDTYTTRKLPEKVAFLGVEKQSILAIGTYGCIQSKEDKYFFKSGLESMLETLEPNTVLVYGSMPKSVFGDYMTNTKFIQYDNWTTLKHGGEKNG